ncbi:MAG: RpiB/LacA/LacB family sugar-phosphate isomerase, partial [Oribacterium sp.]|nr:RpiB/LacA/LacB family sugar-phosphate isomerase [Oribacterium sp.]
MKLVIGNDHSSVDMKKEIKEYLEGKGIEMIDVGTNSTDSFNYPISGYRVGKMVA